MGNHKESTKRFSFHAKAKELQRRKETKKTPFLIGFSAPRIFEKIL